MCDKIFSDGKNSNIYECNHISIDKINQIQITNKCIQRSYESIKSAIVCYVNSVSETFRNLNAGVEYYERGKMNVIIETFITSIHQVCGEIDNVDKQPNFHLVIQQKDASGNNLYSLGTVDSNSSNYNITDEDTSNIPNLHPGKLSIIRNCDEYRNGDEILYYYIICFQILYDESTSSLMIKVSDSPYGTPLSSDRCLFPILVDKSKCTYQLFNFTPVSNDDEWESASSIYTLVHRILIENTDLTAFSSEIDKAIIKCTTTQDCLSKRIRLLQYY